MANDHSSSEEETAESSFPLLTKKWFTRHGSIPDGAAAYEQWRHWLRKYPGRSDETKHRKALELASGLSATAISLYFNGKAARLGDVTRHRLDSLSRDLGRTPPDVKTRHKRGPVTRRLKQVALMTELVGIPSPSFHMEVLRGFMRKAANSFAVALHEVTRANLSSDVGRVVRTFRPDAVIMVRLTPDAESLEELRQELIPTVLIHAARYDYPVPPVLANIVPGQETILEDLKAWASRLRKGNASLGRSEYENRSDVIVVTIQDEKPRQDFQAKRKVPGIRNERIKLILKALREFAPKRHVVPDYTFRHALQVFEAYPRAQAYVCLSDEIAVGLKHLVTASGREPRPWVVGFDDSQLAREERITSFGQHLDEVGGRAVEQLVRWFERNPSAVVTWPEKFEEVPTDIQLVLRD